ncbi:E3 ubiquitin-protein ligase TRIM50-like [Hypanus sabinus]|uniref:E3 ubiquitin-protein ligase TRIM50-like n=1 Tax=Hypanus sabinus TaxID=79690 RepID=UPI0028C49C61|nr:E3 ubiquitin-protein ligase TRIM50-like [Hypanus sabinus]XP_059829059.1 E3 ubiquitin-protein ligase TRIM50-like [Hypanus sabinus]
MAAKQNFQCLEDQLLCPICLEVFKQPLMLQCGHSYCKNCVLSLSSNLDNYFTCPVCRKTVDCSSSSPNVSLARVIDTLTVINGSSDSQENCSDHHNPLSLYCENDQQIICGLCGIIGQHKQHKLTPLSSVYGRMKEQLALLITEAQMQKNNMERHINKLEHNRARIINESDVCKLVIQKEFQELRSFVDEEEASFIQSIQLKCTTAVETIDEQLDEMSKILKQLKEVEVSLKKLGNENHLDFIREYNLIASRCQQSPHPESDKTFSTISFKPGFRHDDIKLTVWKRLQKRILPEPEELKLDSSTAHPLLIITNGSTRVECGTYLKRLSLVQERFDYNTCILANKGFSSGKHYWEVIVNDKMRWRLGVIKGTTGRKGKLNKTPENGVWMIGVKEGKIYEAYQNPKIQLSILVRPRKIGVFLDYEGGRLSFYNVDNPDELSLIYVFDTVFQGKIYPIFDLCCVDRSNDTAPITLCRV